MPVRSESVETTGSRCQAQGRNTQIQSKVAASGMTSNASGRCVAIAPNAVSNSSGVFTAKSRTVMPRGAA